MAVFERIFGEKLGLSVCHTYTHIHTDTPHTHTTHHTPHTTHTHSCPIDLKKFATAEQAQQPHTHTLDTHRHNTHTHSTHTTHTLDTHHTHTHTTLIPIDLKKFATAEQAQQPHTHTDTYIL